MCDQQFDAATNTLTPFTAEDWVKLVAVIPPIYPMNILNRSEPLSIAKQALLQRHTIADVVRERGHLENNTLTPDQLAKALDVLSMALSPHSGGKPQ